MGNKKNDKFDKIKAILTVLIIIIVVILTTHSTKIFKNSISSFTLEKGSISYEESTDGYLIRDEEILAGEDIDNGLTQIISEGERVSKGGNVFRYYSNEEEKLVEEISELDKQINEAVEESGLQILSSDIINLENEIEVQAKKMYNLNEIQKIQEYKKKLEELIIKKAKISGEASPEGSYVKELVNKRNSLENELNNSSEIVKATKPGIVSYRVDGLEEILKIDDFSYLNKKLLDDFELKVGTVIPQSSEKGKIINNYRCFIAVYMETEKALAAKPGDEVFLRLANNDKIKSKIANVLDDNKGKIIVFEISSEVEKLIEYRKISLDIIWWEYNGFKVSNEAIITENDKNYILRNKAGYTEKILIKIERQNDNYSIVRNYKDDELLALGYEQKEIDEMYDLKLYDEIVLNN